MIRKDINFKDTAARNEYYRYRFGRPTDKEIVETIRKRIREIVGQGLARKYVFTTEQLMYPLWDEIPDQHHYISQQMSRLVEEYDLPIRKVATKSDNHVLWVIEFEKL